MNINFKNQEVLIDAEDAHILDSPHWNFHVRGYLVFKSRKGPWNRGDYLHRVIMGCPEFMCVDHINHNTLDNRKSNLRICTHAQNMCNRGIHKTNKSGFKGVYLVKGSGKYRARIRVDGKYHQVGNFDSAEEAHDAYVKAAKRLHGDFFNAG